jgi:hypothetical protein
MLTADRWPGLQYSAHVARRRAMADMRSGDGQYQVDQHAPIQRQALHRTFFHHFAYAGILRLEQLACRLDRDRLQLCAHIQLHVDRGLLAHFKIDRLRHLRESGTVHGQCIVAWLQACDFLETDGIGIDFALRTRTAGGDVNMRAGNWTMVRVENGSADRRIVALRPGCAQGCD